MYNSTKYKAMSNTKHRYILSRFPQINHKSTMFQSVMDKINMTHQTIYTSYNELAGKICVTNKGSIKILLKCTLTALLYPA